MTEQQYEDMTSKLIETFNVVYNTDPKSETAKMINVKANTLVNITKICIQTEIVRRSNMNVRATLQQNISRITTGVVRNDTTNEG